MKEFLIDPLTKRRHYFTSVNTRVLYRQKFVLGANVSTDSNLRRDRGGDCSAIQSPDSWDPDDVVRLLREFWSSGTTTVHHQRSPIPGIDDRRHPSMSTDYVVVTRSRGAPAHNCRSSRTTLSFDRADRVHRNNVFHMFT